MMTPHDPGAQSGDRDWSLNAACNLIAHPTFNPDWWYSDEATEATTLALRICNEFCPVRQACLDEAVATDERYGTWGGKTMRQRSYDRRAARNTARAAAMIGATA